MSKRKKFDFGAEISTLLPLILRSVMKRPKTILTRGRLTIPYIAILDVLCEKGTCKMGDLAKMLNMTMSAVTGIVDKMIGLDLLKRERSAEDRRVVWVSLLKKGKDVVRQIAEERKNATNDIFSPLTESEKKEYVRLLRKVFIELQKRPKDEELK